MTQAELHRERIREALEAGRVINVDFNKDDTIGIYYQQADGHFARCFVTPEELQSLVSGYRFKQHEMRHTNY